MFIRKNTSHLATRLATALLTAATPLLLASCSWVTDDYEIEAEPTKPAANYINFTLTVRGGEADAATRAPQGGEYGDGREAAFKRENLVSGITVILYESESATGLSDGDATVDFIKYYPVTNERTDPRGTTGYNMVVDDEDRYSHGVTHSEAVYTTGDQKIEAGSFDLSKKYHVLIIANMNFESTFPKGTSISTVRDYAYSSLPYAIRDNSHNPVDAQNFLITTEHDAEIEFKNPQKKTVGGTEAFCYEVKDCLFIERMAARIDFHTTGGTYVDRTTTTEGVTTTVQGYEYNVSDGYKFVITDVVPFNLYDGEEYLFKRVQSNWETGFTTTYLGDETTSNYVVDPRTASKSTANTPVYYVSSLAADMSASPYKQNMATARANSAQTYPLSGSENIIIAYPKENTLLPTSPLKKYATGLAFIGKYYRTSSTTDAEAETRTYYTYLRHQGEQAEGSYKAFQFGQLNDEWTQANYNGATTSGPPMNFGIVRNNIYRVSVESITDEGIKLLIKVKHWDRFEHTPIYM